MHMCMIDIYRYIYVEIYLHIQIHIYGSINQNSKTAERKHTQKIEPPNFPKSTETQYWERWPTFLQQYKFQTGNERSISNYKH